MGTTPVFTSSRRDFLRTTTLAGVGVTLAARASLLRAADAPSRKLVLGIIGTGGRGTQHAQEFSAQPDVELKYICDVDTSMAANCAKVLETKTGKAPQVVSDLRRVLDDKDVDAVTIATPDHWHAPAAMLACQAGKHVYVEKPCCHNPHEGELLLKAARDNKRIVQHGTQRRSYSKVVEAIQKVHAGDIGTVHVSRGWYTNNRPETGKRTPTNPPPGLDWAMWQGPAPEQPFTENVVPYKWHWYWHWGTGELGNNGIHSLDICRWGLKADAPPRRVTAGGGRYAFADDQETPDTLNITFDYCDKCIIWEGRSCQPRGIEGSGFGIAFYGDKGTIVIGNNDYVQYDGKSTGVVSKVSASAPDAPHLANFLQCIREGGKLAAEIEEGVRSTLLCHLGNIAHRTGGVINLDPQRGTIVGNEAAKALWGRSYNPKWEPKV
jgi:predicted dehydrogenase